MRKPKVGDWILAKSGNNKGKVCQVLKVPYPLSKESVQYFVSASENDVLYLQPHQYEFVNPIKEYIKLLNL